MDKSYHDVVVIVDGKEYPVFTSGYGLCLTCGRTAGWQLWNYWGDKPQLIGGEYDSKTFEIRIAGKTACG